MMIRLKNIKTCDKCKAHPGYGKDWLRTKECNLGFKIKNRYPLMHYIPVHFCPKPKTNDEYMILKRYFDLNPDRKEN